MLSAPRPTLWGALFALYGRSEGSPAPSAHSFLGALLRAMHINCHNIVTTESTGRPATLSAASMGAAALPAAASAVRREGSVGRWPWQQNPSHPPPTTARRASQGSLLGVGDRYLATAAAVHGGCDSAACAGFSFPCGPAVWSGWLTPSPPGAYAAVLLVVLDTQTPCGWRMTVRSTFFTDGRW